MDISRAEGVQGPGRIEGKQVDRVAATSNQPTPTPIDKVEVSQAGHLVSEVLSLPAMRTERVAELKAAIESGTYQTDEKLLTALGNFIKEQES